MNTTLTSLAQHTAMVIETNNLRGGTGGLAAVVQSLERLFAILAKQTLSLKALSVVIVTHDGISSAECERLSAMQDFLLQFALVSENTGYYDAKNSGFSAIPAETNYVVFADSDCIPDPEWLMQLLLPFAENHTLSAVAGRTSYQPSVFGSALTTIDFKYYPNAHAQNATRNFYANNVVFRRDVFAKYAYQPLGKTYRGHCQILGLTLEQAGEIIHYAAAAHTSHRLPDSLREIVQLRWFRGQDTCSLTPYLVKRQLPKSMQWFAHTGPIAPLTVLICRLYFSLGALNHQNLPPLKGLRRLVAYGIIFAVSSIDMTGALARGLGWYTSNREDADNLALSYHS